MSNQSNPFSFSNNVHRSWKQLWLSWGYGGCVEWYNEVSASDREIEW